MGTPKSRGPEAASVLKAFVEEMKASGFVGEALARHRIAGVAVRQRHRHWSALGRQATAPTGDRFVSRSGHG
ncbi:hypothetical protein BVI2075_1680002 [Burkholderia vietnamiensis]|nr:hypothetical protein BVI2075_1680002 [Burkholderia vietnamiensis]